MGPLRPYPVHLVTVLHGLWGQPSHVAYIVESVTRHASRPSAPRSHARDRSPERSKPSTDDDIKVVVHTPETNAVSWAHTYDGIDVCADRVVDEIDDECKRIELDGGKVERFSIVGYSLGGLVARYVLGLLDSRTPSFFDQVRPVNFATFASPAIGIPQYKTFWSSTFRFLGSRLLSRTGQQLYERDRFLPQKFNLDMNQDGDGKCKGFSKYLPNRKRAAEPLLKIMADPRYSFYRALSRFERIDFALARAKAKKVAEARGDDPDAEVDIRDGGLEITTKGDTFVIESYQTVPPPPAPGTRAKRRFRFRLPLLLRPTSYPFSRPVSLLIIALLPVALPLSVCFLVGRFMLQGTQSRRRIREARKRLGEGRAGMLQRVGVRLSEVAELAGADNPEYAGGLSVEGSSPAGDDEARETTHFGPQRTYGSASGTSTPALARPVSPPSLSPSPSPTSASSASHAAIAAPPADVSAEAARYSTDPVLSSSQLFQLQNLNALPQLQKHFVYLPHARNSHGAIVRRATTFEQHRAGVKVVDSWAREFRV
ncbi:hypothetical protein Rhopal_005055-T1 [Rhodotorula paludigena]|uniref:DUF676 domain-containing protein n=1 Tax=Rhodotorula paludigena TaxID=86838 RepID=A0AAV5GRD5_9BASI|nr:hypothetical protein Rhopal_005055-T1 [Rhodotorula paludigena]